MKIDYPYVPGEYGIDFGTLFQEAEKSNLSETRSGSGKKILYKIQPDLIVVHHEYQGGHRMIASVDDNQLTFDLLTVIEGSNNAGIPAGQRHPDMFARKFVDLAIPYFEQEVPVASIKSQWWLYKSVNTKIFWENYKQSGDLVQAANSTWSARAFGEHGFVVKDPSSITTLVEGDVCVRAEVIFKRET